MTSPCRYEPVHEDAIAADADGRYVTFADYEALRERAEGAEAKASDFDIMVLAIMSLEPNIGKPSPAINSLLDWVKRAQQAERDRDVLGKSLCTYIDARVTNKWDGVDKAYYEAAIPLSRCTPGKEDSK